MREGETVCVVSSRITVFRVFYLPEGCGGTDVLSEPAYVLFYLSGIDRDKIYFFIFCIAVDGCGVRGGDPGRF